MGYGCCCKKDLHIDTTQVTNKDLALEENDDENSFDMKLNTDELLSQNILNFKEKSSLQFEKNITALHFFKNLVRTLIVCGFEDGLIKLYDITSDKEPKFIKDIKAHKNLVTSITTVQFQGNTTLVTAGNDTTIKLWSLENTQDNLITTLKGHTDTITSMTYIRYEGKDLLISVSVDYIIKVWNMVEEKTFLSIEEGHVDRINCVLPFKFTNLETFITCSNDKTIQMWSPECKKPIKMFLGHKKPVVCLSKIKLDKETMIMSYSEDKTIKVWNPFLDKDKLLFSLDVKDTVVFSLASITLEDKSYILGGCGDNTIRVIDHRLKKEENIILNFRGHTKPVDFVIMVKIKNYYSIVSASKDKSLKIWKS